MKYVLLIHPDPEAVVGASESEREAVTAEYFRLRDEENVIGGEHLHPVETATTVRVRDGETLTTDGPFADTKEFLNGFFIVEADDVDAALDVAARIPAARMGSGAVEVRPIVEM